MKKSVLASLVTLLVAAAPASAASSAASSCTASSQAARPVSVPVAGGRTKGLVAMPKKAPRALVVVAPGYSYTAEAWKNKLPVIAARSKALAVAPTYRGLRKAGRANGVERSRGIPIRTAVQDLIAYGQAFTKRCKSVKTVVLAGFSIGGVYSGNTLMRQPKRAGGKPLFDYFVGMETIQDVVSEFQLAKALPDDAFVQGAVADAVAELGGTIEEKPEAYAAVNPIEHVDRLKGAGLKGVFLVHGVDDGLVPYSQATDMTKALRAAGVRTDLLTARKRRPGDVDDTTLSGRFGPPSGDSGHAPDWSLRHLVPETGLQVIQDLLTKGRKAKNRDLDATGMR